MPHGFPSLALAVALVLPAIALAETPFAPPEVRPGENGWEEYVDPPVIDRTMAQGLSPPPETPDAAVVRFLASRIRGDGDWRDAMVDDPGRKAKKALKSWDDWTLRSAQLRARKFKTDDRGYVRVWFDLSISGDSETGTDDFTVVREAEGWRISQPPS